MIKKSLVLAAIAVFTVSHLGLAQDPARPSFKKVMIVILENTDYDDALKQKFLAMLARKGALLSNYHAITHPSEPNYIALTSGNTFDVKDDRNVTLDVRHIGDLLEARGKTWKVYAEDYPGHCFLDATSKSRLYARKHVPFLSYKNVTSNPSRCARIVNATEMAADVAHGSLPDYSLYVPNMTNDGHDTAVGYADNAMARTFGHLLVTPAFIKDLLFVVTFDESEDYHGPNQVFVAMYGDSVKPGSVSRTNYTHYSLLRTIEDAFGLGTLGQQDASATAISGIWK